MKFDQIKSIMYFTSFFIHNTIMQYYGKLAFYYFPLKNIIIFYIMRQNFIFYILRMISFITFKTVYLNHTNLYQYKIKKT